MPPGAAVPGPPAGLPLPVAVGESCQRQLCLSRADIAAFAQLSGDSNPIHSDDAAAQRAHHGQIIASGQHSTAMLIGLASSHFSRPGPGFRRELLCLNFNFAFKAPVLADQLLTLDWRVATVEWHARLAGWLVHVDGRAGPPGAAPSVVGRGTLLLKAMADD